MGGELPTANSYNVTITVTDGYGLSSVYNGSVGSAIYTIHRQAGGKGVAFGKISELQGVEVAESWPFYTHGKEIQHLIVEAAHPIGSIIQTLDNSFNPNTLWPWTLWGKVEDCFLYSSGSKNTGTKGGSKTNGMKTSNTPDTNAFIQFQSDGNYVLYNNVNGRINPDGSSDTSGAVPAWSTSTNVP